MKLADKTAVENYENPEDLFRAIELGILSDHINDGEDTVKAIFKLLNDEIYKKGELPSSFEHTNVFTSRISS
ncbi:MAG: hypothetical protein Q4D57_06110 [Clostridia bacterium]|nr:hypothetical protein [Clostridia bacterium]